MIYEVKQSNWMELFVRFVSIWKFSQMFRIIRDESCEFKPHKANYYFFLEQSLEVKWKYWNKTYVCTYKYMHTYTHTHIWENTQYARRRATNSRMRGLEFDWPFKASRIRVKSYFPCSFYLVPHSRERIREPTVFQVSAFLHLVWSGRCKSHRKEWAWN